ncbi:MAG: flavin-containing monooxygenase, partial [Gaiellaceae bacterium]
PGLYVVGMLFLHSFTSMLIAGTSRDTERVVKHLVARSSEGRAQVASTAPVAALAEKRAAS